MSKKTLRLICAVVIAMVAALAAGCGGGGSNAQRVTGLTADGVVQTFFNAAKANHLDEASLYVSPASANDPKVTLKYMTGQSGLENLKNANLLSLKKVAEQGDYAVVLTTLQMANSLDITVKPVGLEKLNGEWYIVDFDHIYQNAKYKVLQDLISKI